MVDVNKSRFGLRAVLRLESSWSVFFCPVLEVVYFFLSWHQFLLVSLTLAVIMWGNFQMKRLGLQSFRRLVSRWDWTESRSMGLASWGLCAYCVSQQNCVGVLIRVWTCQPVEELRACTLKETPAFGWPPSALIPDHGWLRVDNKCRCWGVNVNLCVKGLGSSVGWPRPFQNQLCRPSLLELSPLVYNQVLAHFVTTVDVFFILFPISLAQYLISAGLFPCRHLCHVSALWIIRKFSWISGWIGSSKLLLNQ